MEAIHSRPTGQYHLRHMEDFERGVSLGLVEYPEGLFSGLSFPFVMEDGWLPLPPHFVCK